MKRFFKVLALMVVALFALVSGVDMTLDRMSHAVTQGAFTCYNQQGQVALAYNGNLALCPTYPKLQPAVPVNVLRHAVFTPPSVD